MKEVPLVRLTSPRKTMWAELWPQLQLSGQQFWPIRDRTYGRRKQRSYTNRHYSCCCLHEVETAGGCYPLKGDLANTECRWGRRQWERTLATFCLLCLCSDYALIMRDKLLCWCHLISQVLLLIFSMFRSYNISLKTERLHKWLFFYMFLRQNFRFWLTQCLTHVLNQWLLRTWNKGFLLGARELENE